MYTKKCVVFKICLHALKYKKLYINPNLGGLLEGCFEVVVVVVGGGETCLKLVGIMGET